MARCPGNVKIARKMTDTNGGNGSENFQGMASTKEKTFTKWTLPKKTIE